MFQTADRVERIREFFLFSDCLVWLSKGGEKEGATTSEEEYFKQAIVSSPSSASFSVMGGRRQSDVDLQLPKRPLTRAASSTPQNEEEKWWFRGKIDLLDLDVSLPVASFGGEAKIDLHSPHMSFSLFCGKFNLVCFYSYFNTPKIPQRNVMHGQRLFVELNRRVW